MNKKSASYFLIILCFFFIGINQVCAKENCTSVKLELEKYETYTKMLNTIDCSDTGSESNVAICNEYNVRKNLVITELMKKNDEKKICSNEKKQVNKIIKENEDNCGQIFSEEFNDMVNSVLVIFYIAGPILLILFGSLDFAKATVSAEQDALKKASVNFAKRIAATVLLFMTPTIVNIIISFNVSDKYLSGNAYTCNYKYLVYNKKYKITYVPKNNTGKNNKDYYNVKGGTIVEVAERIYHKYREGGWHYSLGNDLIYGDIKAQSNNPKKAVCCASYVADVLYTSGALNEQDFSGHGYQTANSGISSLLSSKGWIRIEDYNSLQPGDIVFNSEHTQIYVGTDSSGNKLYYSMGTNDAVQKTTQPYSGYMSPPGSEDCKSCFTHAYRQP